MAEYFAEKVGNRFEVRLRTDGTGIVVARGIPDLATAQQFAAAPELLDIAREIVRDIVADGASCDDPSLACGCAVCRAVRMLIELEGPGRCVICGCDEDHACTPAGCGWADGTRLLCNRHPPEDLEVARVVLATENARR